MLQIDELHTFLAIVDKGSLTAAADFLGQTTSGVSRSLNRLEKNLNVKLLSRTTRRLSMTQEGEWLAVRAREVIRHLQAMEQALTLSVEAPSGLVRVNGSTPVLTSLIAPLLAPFRKQYPEITLELVNHEHIIDLIEEQADIALRVGKLNDSSLNSRKLADSRMLVVASHEYLEQAGCPETPDELKGHDLLGFTEPSTLNQWPLQTNEQQGYTIQASVRSSSGEVLRDLARGGVGIACLSDFFIGQDLASGQLIQILKEYHLDWRKDLWVVFYNQGCLPARIRVFVDYLAGHLNQCRC